LSYFLSIDDNEPYIIITSRNQKRGKTIKVILIDTFTEEEAIEFIKKELDIVRQQLSNYEKLRKTFSFNPKGCSRDFSLC
jgi:predicted metal-dependent hydrolase